MSHTPGPWTAKGEKVCNADEVMYVAAKNFNTINPSQRLDANAKLIAAAPELLQALKCALADLEGSLEVNNNKQWYAHDWKAHKQSIKDARVAIAKAIGESK
jgi:hypothetical protein